MPVASTRVSDEFYERVKDEAVSQHISVSDFIRQAIETAVDDSLQTVNKSKDAFSEQTLDVIRSELEQKNEQISQLHQLVAMSQKHSEDLTKQLEDGRQRRSWWRFWGTNSPHPAVQ